MTKYYSIVNSKLLKNKVIITIEYQYLVSIKELIPLFVCIF